MLFTRNPTDAINLLASTLPSRTAVMAFASEHHANLLPWRRRDVTFLPVPRSPGEAWSVSIRPCARSGPTRGWSR